MYYPLYNNPFYYPSGAYIPNICSYGYDYSSTSYNNTNTKKYSLNDFSNDTSAERIDRTQKENDTQTSSSASSDLFSFNGDRLEVFGISINIDDLIILIMLFFMFRENQIDYSIIIILALILFDQS